MERHEWNEDLSINLVVGNIRKLLKFGQFLGFLSNSLD